MLNAIKNYFKKILSDLHSAIVGIIVAGLILSLGGIYLFFKELWIWLKTIFLLPTPLWAATIFVPGVFLYVHFRVKKSYPFPTDQFHESFGCLWDNNYGMRCMSCKKLLKNSSLGPSVFFCSDPKCNNKHILKDNDGNELTKQDAINRIKANQRLNGITKNLHGILPSQATNDPELFPALNETALKKHIALAASHCQFEKDIKHIYLFEGTPFRYQLVVIGKNTKDFEGVNKYWDRNPSDIFEKHFIEVYQKEPERNFLTDWNVIVASSLDEIPDDIVLKKSKWLLY